MKKNYIILCAFLILGIIIIIFSLYITRQSTKLISEEEKKIRSFSVQPPVLAVTPIQKEYVESKKPEERLKRLEFDFKQIPDDYIKEEDVKEIESRESEEATTSGDTKLNKQPNLLELKELKAKGVVIY